MAKDNLHVTYGPLRSAWIDRCFRKKIHMASGAYSTLTAMRNTQIPILFIHGTADNFVPIDMTYRNYRACAAQKRLVVVPGAGHAMSYAVEPETCQKAMKAFWADFDLAEE